MLNSRGTVHAPLVPQCGQAIVDSSTLSGSISLPFFAAFSTTPSCRWSARNRWWQDWHSVSGSEKAPTCPEATQVSRGRITEESSPTTSSRVCTIERHHCFLMLSFSATPSGP